MMRSTFSGLNTMVRGINAQQLSLDTTGHNITNGNTEGYSRQRVNLAATRSQTVYGYYGASQIGTGVDSTSITRARDMFRDKQYWKESSNLEYGTAKQTAYTKIEAIFDESEDNGLSTTLNDFWKSWKTLSTSASDYSTRVVVRDTGKQLAEQMTGYAGQLQDLIADHNDQITLKVDTVNQLTSEICDLNKRIFRAEATGTVANDLRDSRDLLVDKLSSYININVTEQANGSYTISSGGNIMADGDSYLKLAVNSYSDNEYGVAHTDIVIEKTGTIFKPENGELKGLQDSIQESKKYIDALSTMSAYMLTAFNDQHKAGYGMNDETGHNFFGEDGFTYEYDAATQNLFVDDGTGRRLMNKIEIIQAIAVNTKFSEKDGTDLIAAKEKPTTAADPEDTASGNNAIKLGDLLHTNSTSDVLGNVTLTAYYTGLIGGLGVDSLATDRSVTNYENNMVQIDNLRQSVSGVNWDEELTDMIRFQTGYKACSRCLTAMDEMLDKLINSTGTVGR